MSFSEQTYENVYNREARLFMANAERSDNGRVISWKTVCKSSVICGYAHAVKFFDKRTNPHEIKPFMPIFYYVIICACHGKIVYCKKCRSYVDINSSESYLHIYKCYGFDLATQNIFCSHKIYCSVEISKQGTNRELFTSCGNLISLCPQLIALKMNYNVLDEEFVDYLLRNKVYVKKSHKKMTDGIYKQGNFYLLFRYSPEFQTIVEKLMEQNPQCIICNQYYDSFPSRESVLNHLVGCASNK